MWFLDHCGLFINFELKEEVIQVARLEEPRDFCEEMMEIAELEECISNLTGKLESNKSPNKADSFKRGIRLAQDRLVVLAR